MSPNPCVNRPPVCYSLGTGWQKCPYELGFVERLQVCGNIVSFIAILNYQSSLRKAKLQVDDPLWIFCLKLKKRLKVSEIFFFIYYLFSFFLKITWIVINCTTSLFILHSFTCLNYTWLNFATITGQEMIYTCLVTMVWYEFQRIVLNHWNFSAVWVFFFSST